MRWISSMTMTAASARPRGGLSESNVSQFASRTARGIFCSATGIRARHRVLMGRPSRARPKLRGTPFAAQTNGKGAAMATATLIGEDLRLRNAVMHQLEWDPEVEASEIGVAARDGAVTLTGYIGTYGGKLAAERCAARVRGVRAVANDIR